jgi:alkaline phosphatase
MIGDGMGAAQRAVADRYARARYPERNGGLVMNQLPVKSRTSTVEVNGKVTDSAAAGTALACGEKTGNGVLGLGADLSTPLRSVAFDAKDAGMKVGIVTSVPIDHATPASFYAQVPKRSMYYEIDEFLAKSGFDYFAGETMLGRKKTKDKKPQEQMLSEAGYRHVRDRVGFDALKRGTQRVLVEKDLGYAIDGKQEISLADLTRKGIELLDDKHGFFMMIEGGKIDWSGHANDLATNVHETLAFDEAVGVALEFCRRHPDEALLVVTADHETGGLELKEGPADKMLVSTIDAQQYQSAHYADQVKTWKKRNSVSVETAFERLTQSFGLSDLSTQNAEQVYKAVDYSLSTEEAGSRDPALRKMYGKRNAATVACLHALAERSGAKWTTFGHTDTRIVTTAFGHEAAQFAGENDNTDLCKYIRHLITT